MIKCAPYGINTNILIKANWLVKINNSSVCYIFQTLSIRKLQKGCYSLIIPISKVHISFKNYVLKESQLEP